VPPHSPPPHYLIRSLLLYRKLILRRTKLPDTSRRSIFGGNNRKPISSYAESIEEDMKLKKII
jgi:hypothetical protein